MKTRDVAKVSLKKEFESAPATRTRFRHALTPAHGAVVSAGHIHAKPQNNFTRQRDLMAFALVYVTGGSGHYEDNENGEFAVTAGDVVVLFPGLRHSYWPTPEWHESFVTFQGNVFHQLEKDGLLSRNRPLLKPGLAPTLISSFNRLIRDFLENELPSDAILTARIHVLIAEIYDLHETQRLAGVGGNFARSAAALLEQKLETELNLDTIASQFHLSYERFRKRFAAEVGVSPVRYRMLRRIDMAKTLLAESVPIKAIAERLGYCDLYFFSRQFKQVTGQTPAEFRRSV